MTRLVSLLLCAWVSLAQAASSSVLIKAGHLVDVLDPEKLGSLAPGRFAGLVAVTSDPLQDITVLEKIPFVMKSGVVYRNDLSRRD